MIWNPTNAYSKVQQGIDRYGLIERISSTECLRHPKNADGEGNNSIKTGYTLVYIPHTLKKSGDVIIFGIERPKKIGFDTPDMVVQYQDGEGYATVYFDLRNDRVRYVSIDDLPELDSIKSIKGQSLEDGVQSLFSAIAQSR